MTLNGSHSAREAQTWIAPATLNGGQSADDAQSVSASASWAMVKLCADSLDDLERTRIATENRVRALKDMKGLEGTRAEGRMTQMVKDLAKIEDVAVKELERAMKDHPLAGWIADTTGVGFKQAARLMAEIGDPLSYVRRVEGEPDEVIPRTVSKLWAYCGLKPGQKRKRGELSNWNSDAKMRAILLAKKCVMFDGKPDKNGKPRPRSPYRDVYDAERAKWADRDTSEGHKDNHAVRVMAKRILRDIWRASRGEAEAAAVPSDHAPRHSLNGARPASISKFQTPR